MFGIIGGGFGIYGYLPALINKWNKDVFLEKKYQKKFNSRKELERYNDYINWVETREDLLSKSTGLVIAVAPFTQGDIIEQALKYPNIKNLVIEKPVDINPSKSKFIIKEIINSKKEVRVGYTFIYTKWFKKLQKLVSDEKFDVEILWTFKAHHFKIIERVWKSVHKRGGGPLRFYGIHLIAVLQMIGYKKPTISILRGGCEEEPEDWEGLYIRNDNSRCKIILKTNCQKQTFSIMLRNREGNFIKLYQEISPFISTSNEIYTDPRVAILERLLTSLNERSQTKNYEEINELWKETELITEYKDG